MYFDAVLDSNYNVLFNGTPEETAAWLVAGAQDWKTQKNVHVCCGKTLQDMSIDDYLKMHDQKKAKNK